MSGITYSAGCGCCAPNASAPVSDGERKSDVIDAEELKRMVEELVNAFKGV